MNEHTAKVVENLTFAVVMGCFMTFVYKMVELNKKRA